MCRESLLSITALWFPVLWLHPSDRIDFLFCFPILATLVFSARFEWYSMFVYFKFECGLTYGQVEFCKGTRGGLNYPKGLLSQNSRVWLAQRRTSGCQRDISMQLRYMRLELYGQFRKLWRFFWQLSPLGRFQPEYDRIAGDLDNKVEYWTCEICSSTNQGMLFHL